MALHQTFVVILIVRGLAILLQRSKLRGVKYVGLLAKFQATQTLTMEFFLILSNTFESSFS